MEIKELLELIEAIDKSSFSKFSFNKAEIKIEIEKDENKVYNIKSFTDKEHEDLSKKEIENRKLSHYEYIKSPLIGTFYTSPSSDDDVYISIGDKICKDQVIGIIEVMKVMNEVKCNYDGIVEDILISNCDTVEYGQNLVKIKIL